MGWHRRERRNGDLSSATLGVDFVTKSSRDPWKTNCYGWIWTVRRRFRGSCTGIVLLIRRATLTLQNTCWKRRKLGKRLGRCAVLQVSGKMCRMLCTDLKCDSGQWRIEVVEEPTQQVTKVTKEKLWETTSQQCAWQCKEASASVRYNGLNFVNRMLVFSVCACLCFFWVSFLHGARYPTPNQMYHMPSFSYQRELFATGAVLGRGTFLLLLLLLTSLIFVLFICFTVPILCYLC